MRDFSIQQLDGSGTVIHTYPIVQGQVGQTLGIVANPQQVEWVSSSEFGARVYQTQAFTPILSGQYNYLTFNTQRFDTGGMWNAANPSRLTATKKGIYYVYGHVAVGRGDNNVQRVIAIFVNRTQIIAAQGLLSLPTVNISIASSIELNVGDYVELGYVTGSSVNPEEFVPASPTFWHTNEFGMNLLAQT